MGIELLPDYILQHYEVHEWKHASAILKSDFSNEWNDIIAVLSEFRLKKAGLSCPAKTNQTWQDILTTLL